MDFGIPAVYPQSPGIPAYHNDSVWPFVQAYWLLAAAKNADEDAVMASIAALTRASALFLTNKENLVASTGTSLGTAVNSDRQLWSVAGSLAITYRVLFGLHFERDGLHLRPVVPRDLGGTRTLDGFRYRGALLNIQVVGFGNTVASVTLDGSAGLPFAPASLTGEHTFVLHLSGQFPPPAGVNNVSPSVAPDTPSVIADGSVLRWSTIPAAVYYRVYRNGALMSETREVQVSMQAAGYAEFQVSSVDAAGVPSFLSEPVLFNAQTMHVPASADGPYMELDRRAVTGIWLQVVAAHTATYMVAFRYSNGSGAVNTDNCCAIRTLFVDGQRPQRMGRLWDQ